MNLKRLYDELVKKVNAIQTIDNRDLVKKADLVKKSLIMIDILLLVNLLS